MGKLAGGIGTIALGMTLLSGVAMPVLAQDASETHGHRTQHGPESVSDLAESLMDAVVNISITQNAKAEGDRMIAAARVQIEQERNQAREALREQVAALAITGAEQILAREVDVNAHHDLLQRLSAEI